MLERLGIPKLWHEQPEACWRFMRRWVTHTPKVPRATKYAT